MPGWTPEQIAIVASALAALIGAVAAVVSAIFAGVAVRAQRRAQEPHVRVTHGNVMPVYGAVSRNLAGTSLGDPWFVITVHNDSLVPVVVRSAGLAFGDGGTAPFIRPPWPGADELPKPLPPGEEASFYLDELRKIAQLHVEHGDARWAKLGGDGEFHGPQVDKRWLDGWAEPPTN